MKYVNSIKKVVYAVICTALLFPSCTPDDREVLPLTPRTGEAELTISPENTLVDSVCLSQPVTLGQSFLYTQYDTVLTRSYYTEEPVIQFTTTQTTYRIGCVGFDERGVPVYLARYEDGSGKYSVQFKPENINRFFTFADAAEFDLAYDFEQNKLIKHSDSHPLWSMQHRHQLGRQWIFTLDTTRIDLVLARLTEEAMGLGLDETLEILYENGVEMPVTMENNHKTTRPEHPAAIYQNRNDIARLEIQFNPPCYLKNDTIYSSDTIWSMGYINLQKKEYMAEVGADLIVVDYKIKESSVAGMDHNKGLGNVHLAEKTGRQKIDRFTGMEIESLTEGRIEFEQQVGVNRIRMVNDIITHNTLLIEPWDMPSFAELKQLFPNHKNLAKK